MRTILAFLLTSLLPIAAHAQTTFTCTSPAVAFTCTPSGAATCMPPPPASAHQACPAGQTGSIVTSYSCVGTTWTAGTVNTCTAPPTPPSGQPIPTPGICAPAGFTNFSQGVTYYFALPKTTSGAGTISLGGEGGVGTGAALEISYSHVPGDWATAKAMPPIIVPGGFSYPYYAQSSGYVSIVWTQIPAGEQWYGNMRMSNLTGPLTVQISSPGCN